MNALANSQLEELKKYLELGFTRSQVGLASALGVVLTALILAVILVMLAIDLFAHRDAHVIGVAEAARWSALWVALGVAFGGVIWWAWGAEFATQFYAGYLIEKSLAVDNVFVWAVIFSYFAVPAEYQTTKKNISEILKGLQREGEGEEEGAADSLGPRAGLGLS